VSFHVCYYHFVWTTKNRAPWVLENTEQHLITAIREKSQSLKSHIESVNAWFDHVHVAVQITPSLSISDWVRQVKGYSSFQINRLFPDLEEKFRWQESYGVLTFGTKHLPFIVSYIERQKQHHQSNTTYAYLEKTGDDEKDLNEPL
jgi:putative transposase